MAYSTKFEPAYRITFQPGLIFFSRSSSDFLMAFQPCTITEGRDKLPKIKDFYTFSAVPSTEGRVVGLRWAQLKPKGPLENERMGFDNTHCFSLEWSVQR